MVEAIGTAEQLAGSLVLLVQQAKEQVLHADEVVLHGLGFAGGGAEHLIGGLRDIDLVRVTEMETTVPETTAVRIRNTRNTM